MNYVTKKTLERKTSNGLPWEGRLNGADVLTKHNAFSILEKTRLERTHNGYIRGVARRHPRSSSSDGRRRPMRSDQDEIHTLIDNWILWRDAGDWERFRTVWHPSGWVVATWFQGTGDEFIEVSRQGWERGVSILHSHGGTTIEVAGDGPPLRRR